MLKILVTGSKGFIGHHLVNLLKQQNYVVLEYDLNSTLHELNDYLIKCDLIVHLAGVNRPLDKEEFYRGNFDLTKYLVETLKQHDKKTPIIFSSSIQATLDNDYGKSKKIAEDLLLNSGLPVYIYRLNNVFGPKCKPNYNSVVATFCYNIAHDLAINIHDENRLVYFNYVDDVIKEFLKIINSNNHQGQKDLLSLTNTYECSIGKLANLIYYFKQEITSSRHLPLIHDEFELKLFKTFCFYFSDEGFTFNYASDERGYFLELFKSRKYGQISENMSYPVIKKGGHYHTYKEEIFYTVIGKTKIIQQNINSGEISENIVDGNHPQLINIKPLYTHTIENIGQDNSYTLMWISEIYQPQTADTFRQEIINN